MAKSVKTHGKQRIPLKAAAPVKHAAQAQEPVKEPAQPEAVGAKDHRVFRQEGQTFEDWKKAAEKAGNKIIFTGHHPIEVKA